MLVTLDVDCIMSSVMSYFMSMKFNIYISLIVQVLTLPLNLYEFALFKKYVMGQQKKSDGSNLYNEELTAPTAARIAELERARLAAAGGDAAAAPVEDKKEGESKLSPSVAKSAISKDEPRVEVLDEEPAPAAKKDKKSKQSKSGEKAVEKSDSSKDLNDIDE